MRLILTLPIRTALVSLAFVFLVQPVLQSQSWDLTRENIDIAIRDSAVRINKDPMRPGYHLTPPVGCMGDPNGGIYYDGWYHIFYGLQPFAFHPGAWYWAHSRSRDLLHWEAMPAGITPALDMGLHAIGSGSTIVTPEGKKLAFYSQSQDGPMMFWRAEFTNKQLSEWVHKGKNPILTLEHPGLPPYDDFWRDPFVFRVEKRTFMIACADLLEEDYVPVPIFEAKDESLTEWEYKGNLLTVPKYKYRNLEVPEFRKLGDKWIFMASTDAPVDRVNYFTGEFDIENLRFIPEEEGIIDYSGHYYAQETIQDDEGRLLLMAWMPGWDRPWLPTYMNEPLKNENLLWNGCFAIPRELSFEEGRLLQKPVESMKELRKNPFSMGEKNLEVDGAVTSYYPVQGLRGNQLEIHAEFDLLNASFCGMNVLCDEKGEGGLFIAWSGDVLNVDGVKVPLADWKKGDNLKLQVFIDRKFVEVFVNGGRYCISRQLFEENVKGDHVALTSLGGNGRLVELKAWELKTINLSNKYQ